MFTILATIFSLKWIMEHLVWIIIGAIVIIALIVHVSKKRRAAQYYAQNVQATVPVQPDPEPVAVPVSSAPVPDDCVPQINIPRTYEDYQLAYHYPDVNLITSGVSPSRIVPRQELSLRDKGDSIDVYQGDYLLLGSLPENRLAGMVRDWNKSGEPYLAYLSYCSADGNQIQIALAFYSDVIGRFLSANPKAKLFKLAGKQDDLTFPYAGCECFPNYDPEKDKYFVMFDGSSIGVLPVGAVKYAAELNVDPEDLSVMVASIDYDPDKDRDVISVYISD